MRSLSKSTPAHGRFKSCSLSINDWRSLKARPVCQILQKAEGSVSFISVTACQRVPAPGFQKLSHSRSRVDRTRVVSVRDALCETAALGDAATPGAPLLGVHHRLSWSPRWSWRRAHRPPGVCAEWGGSGLHRAPLLHDAGAGGVWGHPARVSRDTV